VQRSAVISGGGAERIGTDPSRHRVCAWRRRPGLRVAVIVGVVSIGAPIEAGPAGAAGASVPGAPIITAVVPGLHSATVSFRATTDGGARISNYRATCTSSNGGKAGSHQGFHSPVTVAGLAGNKSYTCAVAAINKAGVGPGSLPSRPVITLPTVPGVPTITAMTPGWHKVTISFKPTTDGGAPISNYLVTCRVGYGMRTHQGFNSPVTIACAQGGEPYYCSVAAENRVGWSRTSALSGPALSLPVAPGPPKITSATAGPARVIVAFDPPADTGGAPITTYRVTCTSTDGGPANSHQAFASPIAVAGLATGKTYSCVVAARNQVGIGLPSAPSLPVIPLSP
jgi:hypothetical protein